MKQPGVLTAQQIRAARSILDWSQEELAEIADLSVATVRKLELGHVSPRGRTTSFLRKTLEDAGLEFLEFNGVRQKPNEIKIYEGPEGVRDFFDDVYQTVSRKGGDIVIVATNMLWNMLGNYADLHKARMLAIKNIVSVKCITTEREIHLPAPSYCEYRYISKAYVNSVPFYVYGDKYAIRTIQATPSPKIVVIQSQAVADTFRLQFQSMWDKATPLNALQEERDAGARRKARR